MSAERETVILRLQREMKEAPLPVASPQKPKRRVLADGYERQTLEEPLVETEKYRHRVTHMVLRGIVIVAIVAALAVAVLKAGIIAL